MTTPEPEPGGSVQKVSVAFGSAYKAPTVLLESGQVIADATRVTVDCATGAVPKVFVEIEGAEVADLKLDGVVHIVREIAADPADLMQGFLDNIDPGELDRCVLDSMEMGGPQTYGEAALKVLGGWARGD